MIVWISIKVFDDIKFFCNSKKDLRVLKNLKGLQSLTSHI
jgi:hypothetical protein